MTKADITDELYEKAGHILDNKNHAGLVVDAFFRILSRTLSKGEELKLANFGVFYLRDKKPRLGRNPITKRSMIIAGRRVVKFSPATKLRELMNPPETPDAEAAK